ncbi:uncharacterized protein LOC142325710 [Lycorma delicatula]|uniref:uncharacterized protein LOC142325710 n=1 Tax=Lycorma delicatula TaxID=130591 RepID=UPI003F50EFCF
MLNGVTKYFCNNCSRIPKNYNTPIGGQISIIDSTPVGSVWNISKLKTWNCALVSPVPKKGDPHCVNKYRPIQLLMLSPRCLRGQFTDAGEDVHPYHHGFCKGKSTMTNLSDMLMFTAPEFEFCKQFDVVYFDFIRRLSPSLMIYFC